MSPVFRARLGKTGEGIANHKLPINPVDHVGFWISDAFPIVSSFTNTLAGFLLGLGFLLLGWAPDSIGIWE